MLGAIEEFERDLLLERQREGVAKARAEGKYRDRQFTARAKAAEVVRLNAQGRLRRHAVTLLRAVHAHYCSDWDKAVMKFDSRLTSLFVRSIGSHSVAILRSSKGHRYSKKPYGTD
jgi:hypothetical protein